MPTFLFVCLFVVTPPLPRDRGTAGTATSQLLSGEVRGGHLSAT